MTEEERTTPEQGNGLLQPEAALALRNAGALATQMGVDKLASLFGAVLIAIGFFTPILSVTTERSQFFGGGGTTTHSLALVAAGNWAFFLLFVCLALALTPFYVKQTAKNALAILAACAFGLGAFGTIYLALSTAKALLGMMAQGVSIEGGTYALLAGFAALVFGGYLRARTSS